MQAFTPTSTARRNLAHRIENFLRASDGATMPDLSRWQSDKVLAAIEALDEERFAAGQRIMMHVEKALIFEPAAYTSADRRDARQLLDRLRQVLAA